MSGQFVDQQRNERNAGLLLIAAAALAVLAGNGPFAATYQDVLHFKFGPALPHMSLSLATRSSTDPTLMPAWRLAGSVTFRVSSRGATSTP